MRATLHRQLLRIFGKLPHRVRRIIVRFGTPNFTVGAIGLIERSDGKLLLVRQSYRGRWGAPGGLLKRGENALDGVRREVREEVGIDVEVMGEPTVVVAPEPQRVDVVFRARLADGAAEPQPRSNEILECRWFALDELPELQHELTTALMGALRATRVDDGAWGGRRRGLELVHEDVS